MVTFLKQHLLCSCLSKPVESSAEILLLLCIFFKVLYQILWEKKNGFEIPELVVGIQTSHWSRASSINIRSANTQRALCVLKA